MLSVLKLGLVSFCLAIAGSSVAQTNEYRYAVNLNQPNDDKLLVELHTPAVKGAETTFYMPKIIPGTYRESDYGKFVSDLKAFDKKGKSLPVTRLNDNAWKIGKASKLTKITYWVEDIFDTKIDNNVYYMSGSNIDAGKNFVLHTPAFFGYLDNIKEIPFKVSITKPEDFYGSTGLIPTQSTATLDVYTTADYDLLMDSPMMYNVPDTTFIDVANAKVLVSVYSPNGLVTSEFLAERFKTLLEADAKYLGGKLPVEKYAFIMYFESPQTARMDRAGALEHSYSSFYYLPEQPQEYLADLLTDIAAHEFFHIVTPLTIHSEEIEDFNYNEADLSRHLWLYEGVTEYSSDHVQVQNGLIGPEKFVEKLEAKLYNSQRSYNDTLAFTELSRKAAKEYADEYGNVYEKGALIAALLDIKLLELSHGQQGLQNLLRDLSKRFGMNKPFKDEELFRIIGELSSPEITEFLETYVAGSTSLPYADFFKKVGLQYTAGEEIMTASLGQVQIGFDQEKMRLVIADASGMNNFGKQMGFKKGDLLLSLQGADFQPQLAQQILQNYSTNTKEGQTVTIVVSRPNDAGEYEEITLSAPAVLYPKAGKPSLTFAQNATTEQLNLRFAWLKASPVNAADVKDVDSILATLYKVISGDKTESRDWGRFQSLFSPDAKMGMLTTDADSNVQFIAISPQDYQDRNMATFSTTDFYEEEIGRKVTEYNGLATITSAYQYRLAKDGNVAQRGINSIQAVFFKNRWWITSLIWSEENASSPMPTELLKQ